MSVFVEKEVNRKDVYEIKRSYRQNKSNPWLSQIISQVRCVNEKDYHKFYLVVYKTDKDHEEIKEEIFEMPRHGNAENPIAKGICFTTLNEVILLEITREFYLGY